MSEAEYTSFIKRLLASPNEATARRLLGAMGVITSTDSLAEGSINKYYTDEKVDDRVAALLLSGAGISLSYDDVAGTLTITNTGGVGGSARTEVFMLEGPEPETAWPVPGERGSAGTPGSPGSVGAAGQPVMLPADPEIDWPAPPGERGPTGLAGTPGTAGAGGRDGETIMVLPDPEEQWPLPPGERGPAGLAGTPGGDGAAGRQGEPILLPADPEEAWPAPPGERGSQGAAGAAGAAGVAGLPILLPAEQDEAWPSPPGERGVTGASGRSGETVVLYTDPEDQWPAPPGERGPPGSSAAFVPLWLPPADTDEHRWPETHYTQVLQLRIAVFQAELQAGIGVYAPIHGARGTTVTLATASAGTVQLRPNGPASASGEVSINAAGDLTAAGTFIGALTFQSSGSTVILAAGTSGTITFRPGGPAVATGQATLNNAGCLTLNDATAAASVNPGFSLVNVNSLGVFANITGGSYNATNIVGDMAFVAFGAGGGGTGVLNLTVWGGTPVGVRINGNGDLALSGAKHGFFNTAPVVKPTVTGARGGNVALASLLTSLAALGLLTDSSTP